MAANPQPGLDVREEHPSHSPDHSNQGCGITGIIKTLLKCKGNGEKSCRKDDSRAQGESEAETDGGGDGRMSLRQKYIRTACAQAAFLGVTLNLGMIGPSLLDLEQVTGASTQQLSTIFTWRACLGLLASLLVGPLLDSLNRFLLIALCLFADVIFISVAPWMSNSAALIALMAPPEFFNSIIGMGTHLICISIWEKDAGPSLQVLNLMATIGYMLSPLLCKPFLAPHVSQSINNQGYNTTSDATLTIYNNVSLWDNATLLYTTNESLIQYAYLIVAVYDLIVAIVMLSLFLFYEGCQTKFKKNQAKEAKSKGNDTKADGERKKKYFGVKMSILFFIFNVFYGGIEVGYAGLLMTFAVKYLGWSKSAGTNVTAVLQASNAIVTASAVLISRWVQAQVLLFASISIVTAAMLVLSLCVHYSSAVLWVCTGCLGVGYATIMPCSYTWMNEEMEVAGRFSSAYWSGFFVGFMALPAITGHLFEYRDPMWLPYITLGCSLCMLLLFAVISLTVFHKKRHAMQPEVESQDRCCSSCSCSRKV